MDVVIFLNVNLDSDDFLKPDFLEVLYSSAEENGADIACCNYYLYYEKNKSCNTFIFLLSVV